jgi:hypothetical protein
MEPTKDNSLYLSVKQNVFDDIISGKSKTFCQEIRDMNFLRLLKTERKQPSFNPKKISVSNPLNNDPMVYNGGVFPFYLKEYESLSIAVGFAKIRDEAIVSIRRVDVSPLKNEDGTAVRLDFDEDGNGHPSSDGPYTIWNITYHLGKILQINRKNGTTTIKPGKTASKTH